jgi:hypothetical protein
MAATQHINNNGESVLSAERAFLFFFNKSNFPIKNLNYYTLP